MDITTIGVLGAGQMGGGIAQVAAAAGYQVVLADANQELAEKGKGKISTILGKQVEKGKMKAEDKDALVGRIRTGGVLVTGKQEKLPETDLPLAPWPRNLGVYRVGAP